MNLILLIRNMTVFRKYEIFGKRTEIVYKSERNRPFMNTVGDRREEMSQNSDCIYHREIGLLYFDIDARLIRSDNQAD